MPDRKILSITEILLRGQDIFDRNPAFRLVGRDTELGDLSAILMQMRMSNLIVTGPGGVGISSIILGIQASKKDLKTPVDIVGKRFFWLQTDKLFESGNSQIINSLFEKIRQALMRSKNSVVVIEDTVDFLKAAQNHGCTNLINGLMGDIKSSRYQAIFETKDDNLGEILKCDGDIRESCTLYEVKEPAPENLRMILKETVPALERHHGVKVNDSAIETAALLTEKYKLTELRAQPDAAISLLDRALTDYCRQAHIKPQHIEKLEEQLKVLKNDKAASAEIDKILSQIESEKTIWEERQKHVRNLYRDISDGEEEIRKLEDQIDAIRLEQLEKAQNVEKDKDQNSVSKAGALSSLMAGANMDTQETSGLKSKIKKIEDLVKDATEKYKKEITEIYANLAIDDRTVLKSFSSLSGIPVDKLNEDERERLKDLENILAKRVIGQQEPTLETAKAVKRARLGLKMPNKPSGTFMFLGPSGVGKTELAKALAEALQVPLLRFDMSEYMEKHAVAKLIGAPPGYEGYEHGGILTNAARRNPYSVVLFDEIEKAHLDVFNLMLQLLDDARLTDSRGLTASFKDTIIIMTTNIGTPHFLDQNIDFAESKELALAELRSHYKPEFLGRFGGNIYCFQRLGMPVLQAIAKKDLFRINSLIAERGINIEMTENCITKMIEDKYLPREGARSILGYIDRNITSGIADVVLGDNSAVGRIVVTYDQESKSVKFAPIKKTE